MATPVFLTRSPLTLPSVDSPDFLRRLKTLIDYREGQTTDQGGRFVTLEQLYAMGLISSVSSPTAAFAITDSGDASAPAAPTNLVITNKIITHHLSWTNPIDDDLSHIEVWRATSQDRFNATLVAIATAPVEEVDIPGIDQTTNYYYWVRTVDTSGNHSVWNPTNQQGGELVAANVAGEIASIVSKLTGQITDSHLYSTLQTKINGSASAVVTHTGILDDLTAEHYIKTDVNGRIAGFGLHNTGATSDFIINADKFAIITPGSPSGTISKVPFIVGVVDGVSTVGINGQLVVDSTIRGGSIIANSITSDKIGASEIKAINIEADAITGDKIAATSSIILDEGGKLTVGSNNIILDSVSDKLIIAPDNGTIVGYEDLDGHDYCDLSEGNVNFMYWNSTTSEHQLYSSLKRVEIGTGVPNNVPVTIPGIWKEQPKIIVSPAAIMSYNKNYVANQTLVCEAENIVRNGLTYSFTPKAYLRLTDGVVSSALVGSGSITNDNGYNGWTYGTLSGATTVANTTAITINGTVGGACGYRLRREIFDTGEYSYTYYYQQFYINAWITIDGTDYLISSWGSTGVASWNYNFTVSGLTSGAHAFSMKYAYMHPGDVGLGVDRTVIIHGDMTTSSYSTNQSTFISVSDGTLNYMAIGE